jgi:hypothetical protein
MRLKYTLLFFLKVLQNLVSEKETNVKCYMPQGPYLQECINVATKPYVSKDRQMSPVCQVKATCQDDNEDFANSFLMYPSGSLHDGVYNDDGVLKDSGYGNEDFLCNKSTGSFEHNCKVKTTPYKSTDPNLKAAKLCSVFMDCDEIGGGKSSKIILFSRQLQRDKKNKQCPKDRQYRPPKKRMKHKLTRR